MLQLCVRGLPVTRLPHPAKLITDGVPPAGRSDAGDRDHHDPPRPKGAEVVLAGHIGIAIAVKGLRPSIPLWILILATQLPDWADAALCAAGVRTPIPGELSHSFIAIGALAILAALVSFAVARQSRGSLLVPAVVVSHALGDYFTGLKPTWPGGPMIGLGLYDRPALDFVLEGFVITAGWLLYRRSLPEPKRHSKEAFAMLAALLFIQLAADIVFSLAPGMKKC